MSTLARLVVELVGDTSGLARDMNSAKGLVDRASSGMISAGGRLTAGVTAPLLGIGVAALAIGNEYDGAMDTIQTTTGATGAVLEGLGTSARNVFTSIPTDLAGASQAIADLYARTGQTGEGLEDLARAELELARITEGDLNTQIEATTRMFGDWGVAVEDQVPALDMMLRASQETGIGVDTLARQLVQFGAPLRQMGFGLDESTALLAAFEEQGVNSELVMGSLRIALGRMADAGIDPHEGLQQLITDIGGAGSTAEANMLAIDAFGARAGPDMAAAIREGRFEVADLMDTLANGSSTILGTAADTNDFAEDLTVLKNKAIDAAQPLAVSLFQAINNLMPVFEQIIGFVTRLVAWFTNLPQGVQSTILVFVGLAAALGPVLMAVGSIISVITTVGGAIGGLAGVVGGVAAAIAAAAGPILAIIAVIAAVVLAFKLAWDNNFLGIRDTIQAVFTEIREIVSNVMAFFRGEISFEELVARVRASWQRIVDAVRGFLDNIVNAIAEGVARFIAPLVGGVENAREIVSSAFERIGEFLRANWESIKGVATAAWEFIKGIISGAVEFIRGVVAVAMQVLSGDWSGAWDTIKETVTRVWDQIKSGIQGALDVIGPAISTAWENIKTGVGEKVDALKAKVSEAWDNIKTSAGEKWDAIKERVSSVVTGIRDFVVNVLGELVDRAIALFQRIIAALTGGGGGGESGPALTLDLSAMIASLREARAEWETFKTFVQVTTAAILANVTAWLAASQAAITQTWATTLASTQTTWTTISTFLFGVWLSIEEQFVMSLEYQYDNTVIHLTNLTEEIGVSWTYIKSFLFTTWQELQAEYDRQLVIILAQTRQVNQWILQDFNRVWPRIKAAAVDAARQMASEVTAAFEQMKTNVLGVLAAMESAAHASGVAIGNAVADGIRASTGAAVAAAQALAAAVAAYLPSSDARKGPLSTLTASGRALATTFAGGIRDDMMKPAFAVAAMLDKIDMKPATRPFEAASLLATRPYELATRPTVSGQISPAATRPGEPASEPQCITINIYNPVGKPAEEDVMRALKQLSALGVMAPV